MGQSGPGRKWTVGAREMFRRDAREWVRFWIWDGANSAKRRSRENWRRRRVVMRRQREEPVSQIRQREVVKLMEGFVGG